MVLGWSWGVVGRSWGVLERSWEGLGEVLGGLGVILGRQFAQSNFRSIFGSILVSKRVPDGRHFGSQNGAKSHPKLDEIQDDLGALQDHLGAVLGRLGRPPGCHFY